MLMLKAIATIQATGKRQAGAGMQGGRSRQVGAGRHARRSMQACKKQAGMGKAGRSRQACRHEQADRQTQGKFEGGNLGRGGMLGGIWGEFLLPHREGTFREGLFSAISTFLKQLLASTGRPVGRRPDATEKHAPRQTSSYLLRS